MSDIRTVGHGLSQPAALQLKLPEPSHLVKPEPAEPGSRQRWSVASATPTARMAPATGQPCDALASPWAAACPRSPQDGVASSARLLLTSSADTTHGTRHMAPSPGGGSVTNGRFRWPLCEVGSAHFGLDGCPGPVSDQGAPSARGRSIADCDDRMNAAGGASGAPRPTVRTAGRAGRRSPSGWRCGSHAGHSAAAAWNDLRCR